MNNYFVEVVGELNILPWKSDDVSNNETLEDISSIIKKYDSHPSILKIKETYKVTDNFYFEKINDEEIVKKIGKLDASKTTAENDIPAKILIKSSDIISYHLANICNDSVDLHNFPNISVLIQKFQPCQIKKVIQFK